MVLKLGFRIHAERRREFRQHVEVALAGTRPRACIERSLFVKVGEPGVFLWIERWDSAEALARHLESPEHRALVGAIRVLGRLEAEHLASIEGREQ